MDRKPGATLVERTLVMAVNSDSCKELTSLPLVDLGAGIFSRLCQFGVIGVFLILLQACATQAQRAPVESAEPSTLPASDAPVTHIPVRKVPVKNPPALQGLLEEAENHYRNGNWSAAIASAERGLRIERRAAAFYLVLAQSYLQLGSEGRAEEFARQGMRYTESKDTLWRALNNVKRRAASPADDSLPPR